MKNVTEPTHSTIAPQRGSVCAPKAATPTSNEPSIRAELPMKIKARSLLQRIG
jgi:hypothetical protein